MTEQTLKKKIQIGDRLKITDGNNTIEVIITALIRESDDSVRARQVMSGGKEVKGFPQIWSLEADGWEIM